MVVNKYISGPNMLPSISKGTYLGWICFLLTTMQYIFGFFFFLTLKIKGPITTRYKKKYYWRKKIQKYIAWLSINIYLAQIYYQVLVRAPIWDGYVFYWQPCKIFLDFFFFFFFTLEIKGLMSQKTTARYKKKWLKKNFFLNFF